jgi:uncharacterized repeat protein (TIGR01451 family)
MDKPLHGTVYHYAVYQGEMTDAQIAADAAALLADDDCGLVTSDISGTVYHDVDGDADVAEGGTLTFSGATVRLFLDDGDSTPDAGDVLADTQVTDGSGIYTFSSVTDGTYWLAVDSNTLTSGAVFNAGYDATWIWAEQTYGDDASTGALDLAARFGGLDPATSDAAVAANPVGSEHVAQVVVSGANVTGVDYGFSFNAVVTTDDGDDTADNRTVQGSLRQFILNSNSIDNASFGGGVEVYTVNFSIGTGQVTITPTSELPDITDTVILDATSQEGFTGTPLVELRGDSAGPAANGLRITDAGSDGSTIRGLVINRFALDGIRVTNSSNNTVAGNYIGTNAAGDTDLGNGDDGIQISGTSTGNIIGGTIAADRNVISGNDSSGIEIPGGGSTGNFIRGNYIGINAAGDAALGNADDGITISGASGNVVGGPDATYRNVISGNLDDGIYVTGNSNSTDIRFNYVGTNAAGDADLGNSSEGILIDTNSDNTGIYNNVISGNNDDGLDIKNSTGATIQGNYIGVSADGLSPLGNTQEGVLLDNSSGNTFGGTTAAERNLVSGNQWAIRLNGAGTTGNVIQGNYIGTDVTGTASIPNTDLGVSIRNGAVNNTIGGTAAGAGNRIAFNGNIGVVLEAAAGTGNAIRANSIYSNVQLGIDLNDDGVTANDADDPDLGPNNLQNYPILVSAVSSGGNTTVTGTLNSTATRTFAIDFFSSSVADPEGEVYLGSDATVTTDGSGNAAFTTILPVAVAAGDVVTATATDTATGDTSEFSVAVTVVVPPTITLVKSANLANAKPGDTVIYTLTYGNTGAGDATNLVITDTIPANVTLVVGSITGGGTESGGVITWNLGPLAAGEINRTVQFEVTVNAGTLAGTLIDNSATANFDDALGSAQAPVTSNTVTVTVDQVGGVLVAPDQSGSVSSATGSTIDYGFIVTNTGNGDDWFDLSLVKSGPFFWPSELLDSSGTVLIAQDSDADGSWDYVNPTYDSDADGWPDSGILAAGASMNVVLRITVPPGTNPGDQEITSLVGTSNYGPLSDRATATTTAVTNVDSAQILFGILDSPDPALAGSSITYTLTYENTGSRNASSVVIVDTIPTDTIYIAGSAWAEAGVTVEFSTDNGGSWGAEPADPTTVTDIRWTVGVLSRNSSSHSAGFQVAPSIALPDGSIVENNATLQANRLSDINATAYTTVRSAVAFTNSTKTVTPTLTVPGATLTYTIYITNSGAAAGNNVIVTDQPPSQTTYVPGSITGTGADDSGAPTLVWNLGTVAAGATIGPLTFQVTIDNPVAASTFFIENTASIDSDETFPANTTRASTSLVASPFFNTSRKTASDLNGLALVPGDTIEYRIETRFRPIRHTVTVPSPARGPTTRPLRC